jgi:Zn-dependent metalloprotease
MLNLHYRSGTLYAVSGSCFSDADAVPTAGISAAEALAAALAYMPATRYAWEDPAATKMLQLATGRSEASYVPEARLQFLPVLQMPGALRLVYCCELYTLEPLARKRIYIDAADGSVVFEASRLHSIDRPGKAHTKYSGIRTIQCDSVAPHEYYLTESGRGGGIGTYNAERLSGPSTTRFMDEDNDWNNVNADQDEVATDIHWGLESAYDYYKTKFGRNSYDDKGAKIAGVAHYGDKYNNANWQGDYAIFGDGDNISYRPWATPDLCAHELTHGVTAKSADLVYLDEMGAMNESFSDLFGKCSEHFVAPATFTWGVSSGVKTSGLPIRDMSNPLNTGHPRYYKGVHYYTGHDDFGGVHTNSNVQNYWFYLLCEGGSGTRESDGAPFVVTPLGMAKAEQIAYSTLVDYLFPLAQYKDHAALSVTAAQALYGASSMEARQVQMAWYAVGLADKPTAIADPAGPALCAVFPNPSSGLLQVRLQYPASGVGLQLLDLYGRVLVRKTGINSDCTVDISSVPPGIYILEWTEGLRRGHIKIFRQ